MGHRKDKHKISESNPCDLIHFSKKSIRNPKAQNTV